MKKGASMNLFRVRKYFSKCLGPHHKILNKSSVEGKFIKTGCEMEVKEPILMKMKEFYHGILLLMH